MRISSVYPLHLVVPACLWFALMGSGKHLPAQQNTAALVVSVTSATTGAPLRGAQIVVHGLGAGGTTDSTGTAHFGELLPGSRAVEVRYLGYAPQRAVILLESGRVAAVRFKLRLQPLALAGVRVRVMPSVLRSRGFLERRARGSGTFITREEILRMQPRELSDVLRRVAGLTLSTSAFGGQARARSRGTKVLGPCPIQYYIDGVQAADLNVNDIQPNDVEGLEIYRGAATVPFEFDKGSAMCGAIIIWTRIN